MRALHGLWVASRGHTPDCMMRASSLCLWPGHQAGPRGERGRGGGHIGPACVDIHPSPADTPTHTHRSATHPTMTTFDRRQHRRDRGWRQSAVAPRRAMCCCLGQDDSLWSVVVVVVVIVSRSLRSVSHTPAHKIALCCHPHSLSPDFFSSLHPQPTHSLPPGNPTVQAFPNCSAACSLSAPVF